MSLVRIAMAALCLAILSAPSQGQAVRRGNALVLIPGAGGISPRDFLVMNMGAFQAAGLTTEMTTSASEAARFDSRSPSARVARHISRHEFWGHDCRSGLGRGRPSRSGGLCSRRAFASGHTKRVRSRFTRRRFDFAADACVASSRRRLPIYSAASSGSVCSVVASAGAREFD